MTQKKADQPSVNSLASEFDAIRHHWNKFLPYDPCGSSVRLTEQPVGSKGYFKELETYRAEKTDYLGWLLDFTAYKGQRLLEVGCGIGIDLVQFAKHGAIVTGIDLAETPLELAKQNFALHDVSGDFRIMNGEDMQFNDDSFDVVYCRAALPYTYDKQRMIREIHRVLRPGGEAFFMVFNRYSWLNLISRLSGKKLLHEDAPVYKTYSTGELRRMLIGFSQVEMSIERFPVRTRIYRGLKAGLYNTFFVRTFNLMPRAVVRPFGAHIFAKAIK